MFKGLRQVKDQGPRSAGGRGHISTIDHMKGVGILLVVLGHAIDGTRTANADAGALADFVFDWIYCFHMPLFFSISGFMLAFRQGIRPAQKKDRRSYLLEHLLNYGILYLVYSILYCISKIAFSGYVALSVTWKDVLLLPVRAVGPYWYLYVLLILYAVFATLYTDTFPAVPVFLLLIPLSVAGEMAGGLPFELARVMKYSFYYSFGILSYRIFTKRRSSQILYALLISLIISTAAYAFHLKSPLSGWRQTLSGLIAALAYIVLINCISAALTAGKSLFCRVPSSFFVFLGQHSLVIFLLHVFFLTGAVRLFSALPPALVILLSSVAGILFPLLIEYAAKILRIDGLLFSPGRLLMQRHTGSDQSARR